MRVAIGAVLAWSAVALGLAAEGAAGYFVIRVVDEGSGRGVPLVELTTVNQVSHVTDSAGVIALQEPDLMGREIYFHVRGHGYEYPKDGFGFRGVKLAPRTGERATVKVRRRNLAERLYRITGGGIYRDSVLAGRPAPLREPLLNGQVFGQDTVIVAPYRGRLYWFWGDTEQAAYPLGNYGAAGATSELPARGGLPPDVGVDLTYFVGANGFTKPLCPNFGPGLHWIESAFAVRDETGRERLVARVSSQKGLVKPHAWHLALWDDAKEAFESKVTWQGDDGHDAAHAFRETIDGVEYVYLYPNFRVRAEMRHVMEPGSYEAFTCVAGDGKFRGAETKLGRDAAGTLRYAWKAGADRLEGGRLQQLIAARLLRPEESWLHVRDFETGRSFSAGRGSVFWNAYRRRWIMIMAPAAGEVWFAEADSPTGPWGYARRVVTHDDYNFYNVTQHPFFDEEGGRRVYFEGTYTASFSAAKAKTPRYDYNQVMYRLTLDDARLALPQAVHRVAAAGGRQFALDGRAAPADARAEIAFYALPPGSGRDGVVAVRQRPDGRLEVNGEASADDALFLALPAVAARPAGSAELLPPEFHSASVVPLFEYRRADGAVKYAVDPAWAEPGFVREADPLCRVWAVP